MHIHNIFSGKYKRHLKLLLRTSYRDGRHVKKYTLANLSKWSWELLAMLEQALEMKHAGRGTALESEADRRIFSMIFPGVDPSKQWRLFSSRAF